MEYRGFVGPSYPSLAYTADQERTVNFYFEQMESPGATTRFALYPTPGIEILLNETLISAGIGGGGRAHFGRNGREFAIIGNVLLQVFEDGTFTNRGTVLDDGLPATIDSNPLGTELFICSGNNGYLYSVAAATLTPIAALANKARMGAQLDGYFLALDTATSTFYFSALLDGSSWNTSLDFAQRFGPGDAWIAMKVNKSYIYLLGEQTSEVWYDTGASFPFARHPSGQLAVGCSARWSVAIVDKDVVFLGATATSQGAVYKLSGFTPERVSSFAFETAISTYDTIADGQADTYYQHGHAFYIISFPDENKASWLWDSSNGMWTEQGSWDQDVASDFIAWQPRWAVQIFGQTRILHATAPAVYLLSSTSTNDQTVPDPTGRLQDPDSLRRLRRAPAMVEELERIYYPAFELDLQPGVGEAFPAQALDPQVMMRQSKDGGRNWTSERLGSAGKTGEYGKRIRWNRCGMGRRMVFEVSMTDPVQWRITNAYLPGVRMKGQEKGQEMARAS